jgi:hypothetical protein
LVEKPEGKRELRILRRRWADNIVRDLRQADGVVWTESIWLELGTSEGLL